MAWPLRVSTAQPHLHVVMPARSERGARRGGGDEAGHHPFLSRFLESVKAKTASGSTRRSKQDGN